MKSNEKKRNRLVVARRETTKKERGQKEGEVGKNEEINVIGPSAYFHYRTLGIKF